MACVMHLELVYLCKLSMFVPLGVECVQAIPLWCPCCVLALETVHKVHV